VEYIFTHYCVHCIEVDGQLRAPSSISAG